MRPKLIWVFSLVLLHSIFLCGCTAVALRHSTSTQRETVSDIVADEVLYNLALYYDFYHTNRINGIPAVVTFNSGMSSVTEMGSLSMAVTFNGGPQQEVPNPSVSHGTTDNWSFSPLADPSDIDRIYCLYRVLFKQIPSDQVTNMLPKILPWSPDPPLDQSGRPVLDYAPVLQYTTNIVAVQQMVRTNITKSIPVILTNKPGTFPKFVFWHFTNEVVTVINYIPATNNFIINGTTNFIPLWFTNVSTNVLMVSNGAQFTATLHVPKNYPYNIGDVPGAYAEFTNVADSYENVTSAWPNAKVISDPDAKGRSKYLCFVVTNGWFTFEDPTNLTLELEKTDKRLAADERMKMRVGPYLNHYIWITNRENFLAFAEVFLGTTNAINPSPLINANGIIQPAAQPSQQLQYYQPMLYR